VRWTCLGALALIACDEPSFVVTIHRADTSDDVQLSACDGCLADPFATAPTALTRALGFFVHSRSETLTLEWSVQSPAASRCDSFTVPYPGAPAAFDVVLWADAPPTISGCAACGTPQPCSQGGPDAGVDAGSDAGIDAGAVDAGTDAGIRWDPLSLPPDVLLIIGVRAFSANDVWVAAVMPFGNVVLHYSEGADGGSWTTVTTQGATQATDFEVALQAGRFAMSDMARVFECDQGATQCLDGGAWLPWMVTQTLLVGLCTDGQTFYLVGHDQTQNKGLLLNQNGAQQYRTLASFQMTPDLYDCAVLGDGTILAVGYGYVGRHLASLVNDAFAVKNDMFDGTSTIWRAIATAGGRTFIAGDGQQIVEMLSDAGFVQIFAPAVASSLPLNAIAGVSPTDLYAAGEEPGPRDLLHFDGTSWSALPSLAPRFDVLSLTVTPDGNTWFAGGQLLDVDGGVDGGLLLRGRRSP
jgi:hypothetical protein